MALLNFRFGYGTWDELKEMRRKISKEREKQVWAQAELRRNLIEGLSIFIFLNTPFSMNIYPNIIILFEIS